MNLNDKNLIIDDTRHDDLDFLKARCDFLYKKAERLRIENILLKAVVEKQNTKQNESRKSVSSRTENKTGKD